MPNEPEVRLAWWLSGKRTDEAVASSQTQFSEAVKALNVQYARDVKALASAANFVAQVDGVGGGVTYQRTDNGALRVIIDFGDLPIASVAKASPRQAIVDLAPVRDASPVSKRQAPQTSGH